MLLLFVLLLFSKNMGHKRQASMELRKAMSSYSLLMSVCASWLPSLAFMSVSKEGCCTADSTMAGFHWLSVSMMLLMEARHFFV